MQQGILGSSAMQQGSASRPQIPAMEISAMPSPISQVSQHVFRKRGEEDDLIRKAQAILTVGAMLLAGGAAVVFTCLVVFFLLIPAVIVLSPLFLVISVLSVLYHKVSSMFWQLRRPVNFTNYNWRMDYGLWTVISEQREFVA